MPPGVPPTPPSPGNRQTRLLLVVIAVVAFLAAVTGGLVVLTRDGGGDVAADRDQQSSTTTEARNVEPPPVDEEELGDQQPPNDPTTTDPPAGPVDAPLVAFTDEEGGYSLMVPETWGYASIDGDLAGVGAEAFPDDPQRAQVFEDMASIMPRQMLFLAIDPELMSSQVLPPNVNVVAVPERRVLDPDELEDLVVDQLETVGAEIDASEVVSMGPGDGVRIEYSFLENDSMGLAYAVLVDGTMWSVTCSAAELESYRQMFDDIGSSLTLL
jgi:hypothetical protein